MAGFAHRALALRGDRLTTGHVTAFFDRFAGLGKHVVALSERVLREVQSLYGLRGQLLPIPVDTDRFRPRDRGVAREVLGLPRDGPIGLFVGRLDRTKGFDVLLEVAARMPDVRFLVAGGHGAPQANVEYLGRVPHDAMPMWYAASDFFFLPSRYEGFGLALLEALSCDVPAIVSESAWPFPEGPAECGRVVRGEAAEDFVAAIRAILATRTGLHPRDFVVPRCNFDVFRSVWRQFMDSLPNEAG